MRTNDTHNEIFTAASATLWLQTLHEVMRNPSRAAGVIPLGGYCEGPGDEKIIVVRNRAIDALRLHDIITRNSFSFPNPPRPGADSQNWGVYRLQSTVPEQQSMPQNTALFCQAALIKHSCMPNVEKHFTVIRSSSGPLARSRRVKRSYSTTQESCTGTFGGEYALSGVRGNFHATADCAPQKLEKITPISIAATSLLRKPTGLAVRSLGICRCQIVLQGNSDALNRPSRN